MIYSSPNTALHKQLTAWLCLCIALIALMVVVGGLTRLTESGLSIVEWKPVTGIVPPLSQQDWQIEFEKYQASPQYQKINQGMSLEEFKGIFALEYIHRLLGRLIGFVFLLPYLYFVFRWCISRALIFTLGGIFLLGGLEGLMGWLMVKSGLVDHPWVSPVRLMLHLAIAFLLIAFLVSVLQALRPAVLERKFPLLRGLAYGMAVAVFVQAMLGALVSGNRAGLIDNTFPLMEGYWVPPGLLSLTPLWRNFVENAVTVQFMHRMMAYVVTLLTCILLGAVWRRRSQLPHKIKQRCGLVFGAFLLQFSLGVLTLLAHVPVALASLHQANAVFLFILCVVLARDFDSRSQLEKMRADHGHAGANPL